MMKPNLKDLPRLTPAELEVMKVLWETDGLSAREVHTMVGVPRDWAYSTTRTHIDRLVRKGLVEKASFHGLNVFKPSISRASGLARMVRDFAHQVLGSSPQPVVSLFAETGQLDGHEIDELTRLLEASDEREV
jgi:predicted transcriptional regulator